MMNGIQEHTDNKHENTLERISFIKNCVDSRGAREHNPMNPTTLRHTFDQYARLTTLHNGAEFDQIAAANQLIDLAELVRAD